MPPPRRFTRSMLRGLMVSAWSSHQRTPESPASRSTFSYTSSARVMVSS
jgi:hypothetical protein